MNCQVLESFNLSLLVTSEITYLFVIFITLPTRCTYVFHLDEKEYAVKIIRKDKGYTPEMSTKIVELEANTMINLGTHPNLVNMVDANKAVCCYKKVDPECKKSASSRIDYIAVREEINYLVLEKCSNGSLSKYVKTTGPLEELVSRFLFTQLCSAVHFMHAQEYVHLDIKLDNILLDENYNLKLGDLGIALCAKGTSQLLGHKRGTNGYMAPEAETASSEKPYNVFSADIYSVGVCLHLLLLGCYPTVGEEKEGSTDGSANNIDQEDTEMTAIDKETTDKLLESYLSNECRDLLERLVHKNPDKRLSIEEIGQHPWMTQEFPEDIGQIVYLELSERMNFLKQKVEQSTADISIDME